MRPVQLGHSRTSTKKTRCKSSAHEKRDDKGIPFNDLSPNNNCSYAYTFFAILVTYAKQKYLSTLEDQNPCGGIPPKGAPAVSHLQGVNSP